MAIELKVGPEDLTPDMRQAVADALLKATRGRGGEVDRRKAVFDRLLEGILGPFWEYVKPPCKYPEVTEFELAVYGLYSVKFRLKEAGTEAHFERYQEYGSDRRWNYLVERSDGVCYANSFEEALGKANLYYDPEG